MTPEQVKALQDHIQGIAAILYEDTPVEKLTSLESLERTVRQQMLEHVTPQVGIFLSKRSLERTPVVADASGAASGS